jgi:hypothetical protein
MYTLPAVGYDLQFFRDLLSIKQKVFTANLVKIDSKRGLLRTKTQNAR